MSLIRANRVCETSTTTGTGALTLATAVTGYQRFSAAMTTSDTCYYTIEGIDTIGVPTGEWECGLGTYSSANTLTRTTVISSSNAGAAVSFSAGTKRVFIDMTAAAIENLISWKLLTTWDQAIDGTVAEVVSPVLSGYSDIMVIGRNVTASASTWRGLLVSVNGGSSYYTTSGDYETVSGAGVVTADNLGYLHGTSSASARSFFGFIHGINLGTQPKVIHSPARTDANTMFVASASAINRVKVAARPTSAANFTGGTIQIYAR